VRSNVNVGDVERLLSGVGGGLFLAAGLRQRGWAGLGLSALGGWLAYRGLSGHSPIYDVLDINTAPQHTPIAAMKAGEGVKVTRAVTIQREPEALYRFWRDFDNLPRFMSHLLSVSSKGPRSHWVAKGPAGTQVEWDAEIVTDDPGQVIGWRSLEGSQISTAGSVHFQALSNNRGTEVRVTLKYDPPGGKLGSWLAWLFGQEPGQQIRADLRRFKQLMEAGEIPTVKGQASCRYEG